MTRNVLINHAIIGDTIAIKIAICIKIASISTDIKSNFIPAKYR
jgi:hypothetical protein